MGSVGTPVSSQRPAFHITAPGGWMNDPCGPGYDPSTGTYHLFYQWNPRSCEWGNISWGQATSKDMVHWEHVHDRNPAVSPDQPYDKEGVFTGCFLARGAEGEKGQMALLYSSVCHLPIHWTIPYVRGCEGVSLAVSQDGGKSWEKFVGNPVLKEEPEGLDVTGFRDPYVAAWPALDEALGSDQNNLYGVVSGGVRHQGACVFLYKIDKNSLTTWKYIGTLFQAPLNLRRSPKWSGDFGANWECAAFMTLVSDDQTSTRNFIITGSEGGHERSWVQSYLASKPAAFPRRTTRYCMWLSGSLVRSVSKEDVEAGLVSMTHDMDGILDHGCFYAANSFFDPVRQRKVVWGWLPEEDLPAERCEAKGWNGSLALPRELFLQRIEGVVGSLRSDLHDIGSIRTEQRAGAFTVETLGIRPLPELVKLRSGHPLVMDGVELPTSTRKSVLTPLRGIVWEIEATIHVNPGCTAVGFLIRHDQDHSTSTSIEFRPDSEEIVVLREQSNPLTDVNKCDERGPFTLFKIKSGACEEVEPLTLRIFSDHDILEIYTNDRFALSTMIYGDDPRAVLTSLFARGAAGSALFKQVRFWDEMGGIFKPSAVWSGI